MNILLTLSYLVHLVATVVWLGGMLIFSILVAPLIEQVISDHAENQRLLLNLQKRFRPMANLSLLLLLGTGMVQMGANPEYGGFFEFSNTWSLAMLLKHIAFGGMILVILWIQFSIVPELERATLLATQKNETSELQRILRQEKLSSRILLGLGGLVLIFTAVMTAV